MKEGFFPVKKWVAWIHSPNTCKSKEEQYTQVSLDMHIPLY